MIPLSFHPDALQGSVFSRNPRSRVTICLLFVRQIHCELDSRIWHDRMFQNLKFVDVLQYGLSSLHAALVDSCREILICPKRDIVKKDFEVVLDQNMTNAVSVMTYILCSCCACVPNSFFVSLVSEFNFSNSDVCAKSLTPSCIAYFNTRTLAFLLSSGSYYTVF